ncbi:MAG: hypothetical protein JKY66_03220 [Spongiibacteraceae bacterium]|nr:hypothetical protein [Spongiibacteraceae bacterium]
MKEPTQPTAVAGLSVLPRSSHPLVAIESLTISRHSALESLVITMPPQYLPTDPSAHLFQPPIQVVVLEVDRKQVTLGVYADSFLQLQQGPPPTPQWLEHWHQSRSR